MLDIFKAKERPVDKATLRQILDKEITPAFVDTGLQWNGDYLWFNQSIGSIRRVFTYDLLKGEQGTFSWGVCLDFVPTISGRRLQNHRTDKSVTLHLFEWPKGYVNSFASQEISKVDFTSHWGMKNTTKSIRQLIRKYEQPIKDWFQRANTIDKLIDITKEQVRIGEHYNIHYPAPQYVLAFLYAKSGDKAKGLKIIEDKKDHFFNADITLEQKVIQRLTEIK